MARGLSFTLHNDGYNDCGGGGGCMSSSADGGWREKLMRREKKSYYPPSSSSSSSSSSASSLPSSPQYLRTLKFGRGSSEIVGDVFYGTDDAAGIDECKYKEDVLEHYRKERERKSVRRQRERRQGSWYGAVVDWFRSILCCFR